MVINGVRTILVKTGKRRCRESLNLLTDFLSDYDQNVSTNIDSRCHSDKV